MTKGFGWVKIVVLGLTGLLFGGAGALPDDVWPYAQDDAASGGDAPDEPVPAVWVVPGVVYEGTLSGAASLPITADWDDYYAFDAEAGDVVRAKARGIVGCFRVTDAAGEAVGDVSCTLAGWDVVFPDGDETGIMTGHALEVTLEESGLHFLHYYYLQPQQYRFVFTVNSDPPEPGLLGAPLPPGPPVPAP